MSGNRFLTFRKTAGLIGFIAAFGLLVAACSSSGSTSNSAGGGGDGSSSAAAPSSSDDTAVDTIRLGAIAGSPPGLLAAIENGTFAKEHINIKLVDLSGGPDIVAAVEAGSVDIGWADMFAWSAAIERGFKFTIVNPANSTGTGDQKNSVLLAKPNSGITSAKDLVGKKIGTAANALGVVELKQWLANEGVDPNGPKYVTVNDRTTIGGLTASGQIDVATASGASAIQWEKQYGLKVIGAYDTGVPTGAATSGYGTTLSWAQSHKDLIQRFVDAVRAGVKAYQAASPAEQNAIVVKYGGADVSQLNKQYPGALAAAAKASDTELSGPFNVAAENKWLQVGVKFGALDKPIDISKYLWPTATAGD